MAITKQSSLSRPPYNSPISQNGFASPTWIAFFDAVYRRVGGANSLSNNELNDANSSNANDLSSLKESVVILEDNQSKLDTIVKKNTTNIESLTASQKSDHESIVTSAEKLTILQNNLTNLSDNLETIQENVDNINKEVNNIEKELYKANSVSTLPDAGSNVRMFAYYNSNLYFSDGTAWKIVTLT